jgi:lipopolysaccharide transport system ATP-binding protein
VEIEFDVFKEGHVMVPSVHLMNEEGVNLFIALGQDPKPPRRPRLPGRHRSTAWIPGNFLAEGNVIVSVGMSSLNPTVIHFHERDVAMFHVQDSLDGDSARGDYAGPLLGVVRPMLRWTNEHLSAQPESSLPAIEISK